MKNILGNRKLVISFFVVAIVVLTLIALVPLALSLFASSGVKTEPVDAAHAKAATGELDGDWQVTKGDGRNFTSVGFTFDEVLPAEKKTTSGSTTKVSGQAHVTDHVLDQANIVVDMTTLTTDKQVRDQNMKSKLFKTDQFPNATFKLSKPADLSGLPTDGTMGSLELTGDLTIKDKTKSITHKFDALRDGDKIIIGGDLPVNREEFNVVPPEFVAAVIDKNGFVNIRVALSHNQ